MILPGPVLSSRELSITILDTKGIDQTAERADLLSHFDDLRTLVVLCSGFPNAPEAPIQTLLRRAREARRERDRSEDSTLGPAAA